MQKAKTVVIFVVLILVVLDSSSFIIEPDHESHPDDSLNGCWSRLADLNQARGIHAVEGVNGKIYVIGGHNNYVNSIEVYDLNSDTWTVVGYMQTYRGYCASSVVDGNIYLTGGFDGENYTLVEVYDPLANSWGEKSSMLNPKWGHYSVHLDGKIYVFGGVTNWLPDTWYETMEIYDLQTDTWMEKECPIAPRFFLSACTLNGKIYVIGGQGKDGSLSSVDLYDPVLDTWESKAPMHTPRSLLATAIVNNKIYAIGGFSLVNLEQLDQALNVQTVEEFDPGTNTWVTRSSIPVPRGVHTAVINNKIYLPGGSDANPLVDHKELFVYDPLCDTIADQ